ncbi:mechanosensitive channel protein [Erwinia tracheiphila PSU-1]|nr:mechanosensitive channel protein [Erwinia tracheiphila PSU-1]
MLSVSLNATSRTIANQQELLLNAFALIELFKAILRLLFCPRYPQLRFFHLPDSRAR